MNMRFCRLLAGRTVTEGEVEEMLESGNPSVFTQGVRSSSEPTGERRWSPYFRSWSKLRKPSNRWPISKLGTVIS